jgi:acetoin utilization deacetylase AcuC-like enzyme
MMHSDGYRSLTRKLMRAAEELCQGRLIFIQEGGYSTWTVPFFGLAVLEELSGIRTGAVDPHLAYHKLIGGQGLLPHQAEAIDAAAQNLQHLPKAY